MKWVSLTLFVLFCCISTYLQARALFFSYLLCADIDEDPSDTEETVPTSRLGDKLNDLTKAYDLIKGKYRELIHAISLSENETGKSKSSLPNLKEKTAVFKVTADALIKVCLVELDICSPKQTLKNIA